MHACMHVYLSTPIHNFLIKIWAHYAYCSATSVSILNTKNIKCTDIKMYGYLHNLHIYISLCIFIYVVYIQLQTIIVGSRSTRKKFDHTHNAKPIIRYSELFSSNLIFLWNNFTVFINYLLNLKVKNITLHSILNTTSSKMMKLVLRYPENLWSDLETTWFITFIWVKPYLCKNKVLTAL